MGSVLLFKASNSGKAAGKIASAKGAPACQIVIFPGVRIERHDSDLDLGHRLRDSAGLDTFDGIGGGNRPRKTS